MSSEITEIEQALEIARKIRDAHLFGNLDFEKQIHGFYTVAQILNREQNLTWIMSEMKGVFVEDPPNYRKNLFRKFILKKEQLSDVVDKDLSNKDCMRSITSILSNLKTHDNEKSVYNLTGDDFKELKKSYPNLIENEVGWVFANDALEILISDIKLELIKRLNIMIAEITYGKIPRNIFGGFQDKVNQILAKSNPEAVSEINITFESLGKSEDPERIAHVAFACRRLIKAVADQLYPPVKNKKHKTKGGTELEIGNEHFLNRLEVFVDLNDSPNRKFLIRKIKILRDLYGEIPQSINKGTHLNITNQDAENLVIYTYLILGDILLDKNVISTKATNEN